MAYRQIRRHLSQRLPLPEGCNARSTGLLPLLQQSTATSVSQWKNTGCSLSRKDAYVKEQTSGGRVGGHIPPTPPLNTKYINNNCFTKTLASNHQLATLVSPLCCLTFGVHLKIYYDKLFFRGDMSTTCQGRLYLPFLFKFLSLLSVNKINKWGIKWKKEAESAGINLGIYNL